MGTEQEKPFCGDIKQILKVAGPFFENSFDAVLITNCDIEDPLIIFVNPAFVKLSGYSQQELLGKSPRILQGPKTNKKVKARLKACMELRQTFVGATVNYKKNGDEYHVEWKVNPIFNQDGVLAGFLSIQRDLTFVKQFLKRLVSTTSTFRGFLNEFLHNDEFKDSKYTLLDMTNAVTKEEMDNMTLFSEELRGQADRELFDNELFFKDENLMGIMPIHRERLEVSARDYISSQVVSQDDIARMGDILKDSMIDIEFARHGESALEHMQNVLIEIQDFANIIFYIDEFLSISTVLGQLVTTLEGKNALLTEEFIIETLHSMLMDLQSWYERIFVTQNANSIHELDDSIIGSAQQIIFMVK